MACNSQAINTNSRLLAALPISIYNYRCPHFVSLQNVIRCLKLCTAKDLSEFYGDFIAELPKISPNFSVIHLTSKQNCSLLAIETLRVIFRYFLLVLQ